MGVGVRVGVGVGVNSALGIPGFDNSHLPTVGRVRVTVRVRARVGVGTCVES